MKSNWKRYIVVPLGSLVIGFIFFLTQSDLDCCECGTTNPDLAILLGALSTPFAEMNTYSCINPKDDTCLSFLNANHDFPEIFCRSIGTKISKGNICKNSSWLGACELPSDDYLYYPTGAGNPGISTRQEECRKLGGEWIPTH